jgi:hypothetical protein
MQTVYQLNADDLNEDFLEGLTTAFKHKEIEIVVYERDETAHLLGSPANRSRLLEAVADVEHDRKYRGTRSRSVSTRVVGFHQMAFEQYNEWAIIDKRLLGLLNSE